MSKKKVAFLGAGSFSDGVRPFIDKNKYEFVGYFDDKDIDNYREYPVFGKINTVIDALDRGIVDCVFVTIGDNVKRREIFEMVAEKHYDALFNIISPNSHIFSEDSIKGRGIFIGFSAFIGADSYVYDNCIVNTGAIVEHHTTVEAHCNITPSATINGLCHIKEGCYLGSGSVIAHTVTIAKNCTIGAGAVVLKTIEESGTYVGVPVKKIK